MWVVPSRENFCSELLQAMSVGDPLRIAYKHVVFPSLYLCSFCYLCLQWFLFILLFIKYFLSIYSMPDTMLSLGDSVTVLYAGHPLGFCTCYSLWL